MKTVRGYALSHPLQVIGALALLCPALLAILGYRAHDFDFHLTSWAAIDQNWKAGTWFPFWEGKANFGFGEPRFYFYPPVSQLLGAVFLLLLPNRFGPALYVFCIVFLAGASMLRLGRYVNPKHALTCAVLYCTTFYFTAELLVRFAIAEALVAAFLPLLVLGYLELLASASPVNRKFTLLLALTWLTNIPGALVVFYILALTTLIASVRLRTLRPAWRYAGAQLLAIGLSCVYLLPAIFAKNQLVPKGIENSYSWRDALLLHRPLHNPSPSLTYPLWAWSLAGVGVLLYLHFVVRPKTSASTTPVPAGQAVQTFLWLPLVFQLPLDSFLWRYAPSLTTVQFSYRFLLFLSVGLAAVVPGTFQTRASRWAVATLWVLFFCIPFADRVASRRHYGQPRSIPAYIQWADSGSPGYPEYLPAGHTKLPDEADFQPVVASPSNPADCRISSVSWAPAKRQFLTSGSQSCLYTVGLFYFPEWGTSIDGVPQPTPHDPQGRLVQLQVAPGRHTVTLQIQRPLAPLLEGAGIAFAALALLLGIPALARQRLPQHEPAQAL